MPNEYEGEYDYSLNPPSTWERFLDRVAAQGSRPIKLPIRWGTHESTKSVRDFSRVSRLRLEKFLQLAHQRTIPLELAIGFFPGPDSFPRWTWDLPTSDLIPMGVWEVSGSDHEFLEIPSLSDPEFKEGYREFQQELFGILELYHYPDGPIRSVNWDPGVYRASLSATQYPEFASHLEERYGSIAALNLLYSTNFKNFQSVATHYGIRALSDRRSWLAAYDYKSCLHSILSHWFKEVAVDSPFPVTMRGPSVVFPTGPLSVVFDDTQLGRSAREFPLSLGGVSPYGCLASYGFWSSLSAKLSELAVPLVLTSDLISGVPVETRTLVLATNRFLQRACFDRCIAIVDQGGRLWAPFGLPQYDENLTSLNWKITGESGASWLFEETFSRRYRQVERGKGQLLVPESPLAFHPEIVADLTAEIRAISKRETE